MAIKKMRGPTNSLRGQWDDFRFARHGRKFTLGPPLFGELNAFLRGGDEIPPYMARRGKAIAAEQHGARLAIGAQSDFYPGRERSELTLDNFAFIEGEFTLCHVHRAFFVLCRHLQHRPWRKSRMHIQRRPSRDDRGAQPQGFARDHRERHPVEPALWNHARRVVREARFVILTTIRHRHPTLDAVDHLARGARKVRCALRMRDTVAGGHLVDVTGTDLATVAETVAMLERARKQISHRGECNMRMRPHVDPVTRLELRRTHVIEENEWAHHLTPLGRQHSAYHEAPKITLPRIDQL